MNHLADEKSPYLLQHAHNPVHWYPWREDAFNKAVQEDKLIFLSIGYATCHWCHVMEKESFTDLKIAEILNSNFVSIKVDREERPDVDDIYMNALHAIGQQGGWPLNMFLTPALKPVIGGTYFPREPMINRPSFEQLLTSMIYLWNTDREKIFSAGESITDFIRQENQEAGDFSGPLPHKWLISQAVEHLEKTYDPVYGGFSHNGPNKFPPSMQLSLLLNMHRENNQNELLEICKKSAVAMISGGIYDQIGGGLCRYATDQLWRVPHFEKMLYDNALFSHFLMELYQFTKETPYRNFADDIYRYILRDMKTREGGFASAEDADSEGEEGKFYLWKYEEFEAALKDYFNKEKIVELAAYFNITRSGNFEGKNILYINTGESNQQITPSSQELSEARLYLLEKRNLRKRPLKDDKIIVSWNGLMISSIVYATLLTQNKTYKKAAIDAATFIKEKLLCGSVLYRRYRAEEKAIFGHLSDYASFGIAAIHLYRLTFDSSWFELGLQMGVTIIEKFSDLSGGFHDSPAENSELILRRSNIFDGVEPSGNSLAARLFYLLAAYGVNEEIFHRIVENISGRFYHKMERSPASHAHFLTTLHYYQKKNLSIAIAANNHQIELDQIINFINETVHLDTAVALEIKQNINKQSAIPILGKKEIIDGKLSVYICFDKSCLAPVHTLEDVKKILLNL